MFALPPLEELLNESDVEQKFVYPLLTAATPSGFGIASNSIQTKGNIRRFLFGKGKEQKSYFPDYILVRGGYPMVVIEAKERGENISSAFREARLYANELNALYVSGILPVSVVVATNGDELWAGAPDQAEPQIRAEYEDLAPYTAMFAKLQGLMGDAALESKWAALRTKIKPARSWKPRAMLGGQAVQDELLPKNGFGSTISANLGPIFNPISREDRAKVVKSAYVPSTRRTRYIAPIDSIIRAASPISHSDAKLISETDRPRDILETLQNGRKLEHKVLLLVGGAGAGKTTFIDYLQEVALPSDLRDQTIWIHFNMNDAPTSRDEIYNWLRENLIDGFRSRYKDIDFDDIEGLKALYSVDVNKFSKGRGRLYESDINLYNSKLGDLIEDLQKDLHGTAIAYCRYCGGERGKLVILVLDNCDKRQRDVQLLMFEAAQWLQREFKALVILPLREETYDNHRDEPPLDTALKDLVFRIEPPEFHAVLSKRVQLARDELKNEKKSYRYDLENSMHVDYQASDQGKYLASIVSSLFGGDRKIGNLLLGLAGSNLRRAFELFLEICNSAHIPPSEILKIKNSAGEYNIPIHFILRALLRNNRRFYDSNYTYIKNLFATGEDDERSLHFLRLAILRWLAERANKPGPRLLKGYFPIQDLFDELCVYGFDGIQIMERIHELARAYCVLSEDFKTENLAPESLIRIGPAGLVHLDLITDINYWAAISEDTYYDNKAVAGRISSRISDGEKHYTLPTTLYNASTAIEYIDNQRAKALSLSGFMERNKLSDLIDFSGVRETITTSAKNLGLGGWDTAEMDFPAGSTWDLKVARIQSYGFFVDFPSPRASLTRPGRVSGLVRKESLPAEILVSDFAIGDTVKVKVVAIDAEQKRVHLELVERL